MTNDTKRESTCAGAAGMSLTRFEALAAAYGGDVRLWPAGDRPAAVALAGTSAAARAVLAEAHELDAALSMLPSSIAPSAALKAKIAALDGSASEAPDLASSALRCALIWGGRGTGLAMTLAAGLYFGLLIAPPPFHDAGDLALVEAALLIGEAPSFLVGDLLELD